MCVFTKKFQIFEIVCKKTIAHVHVLHVLPYDSDHAVLLIHTFKCIKIRQQFTHDFYMIFYLIMAPV